MEPRPLYIPVILGTTRMGRMSAHVARLLTEEVSKQAGVVTDLIDIAGLPLPTNDAGEAIKEGAFSSKMDRADGLRSEERRVGKEGRCRWRWDQEEKSKGCTVGQMRVVAS